MLQQILNDMYIDPDLLSELDEEQKQILFCKMREEQVRRWKIREQKEQIPARPIPKENKGKKVRISVRTDGEPLVEVIGDLDSLLQERARKQAEMESDSLRLAAEEELDKLVRLSQSSVEATEGTPPRIRRAKDDVSKSDPARDAVRHSLQEATQEMQKELQSLQIREDPPPLSRPPLLPRNLKEATPNQPTNNRNTGKEDGSKKATITVQPYSKSHPQKIPSGVISHIQMFESLSDSSLEALKTATLERAKKRRQKEIFDSLRNQAGVAKHPTVEEIPRITNENEEVIWREQEKKAKEAEKRTREIARRARVEHRRPSLTSLSPDPTDLYEFRSFTHPKEEDVNANLQRNSGLGNGSVVPLNSNHESSSAVERRTCRRPRLRPIRPSSKSAIIEWFQEEELPKGVGLNPERTKIQPWFHGIISRLEAEMVLESAEVGSFLIRVSERIWGYTASYKGADKCRHYLVDASGDQYSFLGTNQTTHPTLDKLIEFHTQEYITMAGEELLCKPCGQDDVTKPDYLELFMGTNYFHLIQ